MNSAVAVRAAPRLAGSLWSARRMRLAVHYHADKRSNPGISLGLTTVWVMKACLQREILRGFGAIDATPSGPLRMGTRGACDIKQVKSPGCASMHEKHYSFDHQVQFPELYCEGGFVLARLRGPSPASCLHRFHAQSTWECLRNGSSSRTRGTRTVDIAS